LDAPITFGDLDYDGLADAAVLLAENTGGTGVFVSMIAVLNRDGSPLPVASIFIEDRPMINSLVIQSGEVLLDAVLHGASDPMCCPTRQVWEGYRLYNENTLVLSRWAEMIPGVGPRQVDLTSPVDLETVSYPFTIFGGVTMWPFENTLAWNVYAPDNAFVTGGSVMTDAADIGEPGNFTLDLDLTMAGVTGLVRVEFVEYSMADGSVMTLDSVLVNIP